MVSSSYNFGKFDLGGFSKSVSPKLSVDTKKTAPKKNPDYTVTDKTTAEQALIYRLSGYIIQFIDVLCSRLISKIHLGITIRFMLFDSLVVVQQDRLMLATLADRPGDRQEARLWRLHLAWPLLLRNSKLVAAL